MKKIKYVLIICIILAILLIVIILINNRNKNNQGISETQESIEIMKNETVQEEAEQIINIEEYIEVKNCANAYLNAININNSAYYGYDENGDYTNLMTEEDINANMYEVLSAEYINKNSINTENIRNYVYAIEEDCFFVPVELIEKGSNENIKSFGVYGIIVSQEYEMLMEGYIIINIDEGNNTFSIEQVANKDELNNIEIEVPDIIEEKNNNVYTAIGTTYEDIIQGYIDDYKRLAIAYPELAYDNFLDEEYKSKKFESVDEYKEYINENRDKIELLAPEKYEVSEQDNYTRYLILSNSGQYIIIKAETPSKYKFILDTYTIDIPEFTEKYNSSAEQQKVALNIDKFIQALNAADYKYAYNCLADSFKNNYFKTQEEFETYAKENFYKSNTITYNQFNIQGEYYTYSVTITNQETNEGINKTFIMQLGEGTEFVLSFDI